MHHQLRIYRDALFVDNRSIRASLKKVIKKNNMLGNKIGHCLMRRMESINIKNNYDFWLASKYLKKEKNLKISKINFYPLKSGVVIVEINSDNGFTGIGQFIGNSYNSQKYYFEERLEKILINKKIDVENIWNELYWNGLGKMVGYK